MVSMSSYDQIFRQDFKKLKSKLKLYFFQCLRILDLENKFYFYVIPMRPTDAGIAQEFFMVLARLLKVYLQPTSPRSSRSCPLHLYIDIHILHTDLCTFPMVTGRKICRIIRSFLQ